MLLCVRESVCSRACVCFCAFICARACAYVFVHIFASVYVSCVFTHQVLLLSSTSGDICLSSVNRDSCQGALYFVLVYWLPACVHFNASVGADVLA